MRKTGKEILGPNVTDDERHAWLVEATANELLEFLRWVKADSSWALHGRDALNVVLAKENIKLQKAIRKLTIWIFVLTFIMVLLGIIQIYPNLKNSDTTSDSSLTRPKSTSADNQAGKTDQFQDKNKVKILNHK